MDHPAYGQHVIHQLAKMQMNFIGLHTYPYNSQEVRGPRDSRALGPIVGTRVVSRYPGFSFHPQTTGTNEPTVWIGTKDQVCHGLSDVARPHTS